jgi:hypothetical protein
VRNLEKRDLEYALCSSTLPMTLLQITDREGTPEEVTSDDASRDQ